MEKIDWFNEIVKRLKTIKADDFWSDGEVIMCVNLTQAESLADLIEKLYKSQGENIVVNVDYYDKREDERRGTLGLYSETWYIFIGLKDDD